MKYPARHPSGVVPARNWHWQWLAEHMRPDEREHWLALAGGMKYMPDVAAIGFMNTPGIKLAVLHPDGMPAVAGGFTRVRGKVFEGWLVGTVPAWAFQWRNITKAVRWMMGQQFKAGAQRLQIVTLESRTGACRWYEEALGMTRESVMQGAGANGENLVMYVKLKGDHS